VRLSITAVGRPAPQGSHELGGAGQLLDSSPYLPAWRQAIKIAAFRSYSQLGIDPLALPVFGPGVPVIFERITFHVAPEQCRAEGTAEPIGKPDVDKLLRSTLDALGGRHDAAKTARLFADESQVVEIRNLSKQRHGPTAGPGALIIVTDGRD
jgi:hypothetical protein